VTTDPTTMEYFDDEPSNSYYASDKPSGSGITLRLPALGSGKAGKLGKKRKSSSFADHLAKAPKPVKLKPLREVLTRLVGQIKK
jgi:bromodomain-containing protein 7/9